MSKALLLIDEHEKVKQACEKIKEIRNSHNEKMLFIKKQVEDAEKALAEEVKPFWQAIESEVSALNKLPDDYSREKYTLSFSDSGVLEIESDSDKDAMKLAAIARMMKGLFE